MRFSIPIKADATIPKRDLGFQRELDQFLNLFSWQPVLQGRPHPLIAADIGCRNFALAPVLHQLFQKLSVSSQIYGVEIDAHRRLANFRTRGDYGRFFANQVPSGQFEAIDFLQWRKDLDVAFLLNPFVSEDPILDWGLPKKFLKPTAILKHARELLERRQGILLLSSPEEEWEISFGLARKSGFSLIEKKNWHPSPISIQKKTRFGGLFRLASPTNP